MPARVAIGLVDERIISRRMDWLGGSFDMHQRLTELKHLWIKCDGRVTGIASPLIFRRSFTDVIQAVPKLAEKSNAVRSGDFPHCGFLDNVISDHRYGFRWRSEDVAKMATPSHWPSNRVKLSMSVVFVVHGTSQSVCHIVINQRGMERFLRHCLTRSGSGSPAAKVSVGLVVDRVRVGEGECHVGTRTSLTFLNQTRLQ